MKRKMLGLTAALLMMSGLTACANPLMGMVKAVAMQNSREWSDEGEVELRELEVKKIEPDAAYVKEEDTNQEDAQKNHAENEGEEIIEERVPLESAAVQKTPEDLERRTAYLSALQRMYDQHVFPDASPCELFDGDKMEDNHFSIYDIDQDGREELIIEFSTTNTAGMIESIYEFDVSTNTFKEEFMEFPALTFYEHGVIEAGWSHNQGLAGRFWPYNLYQYQPETDTYVLVGMVDAWDKGLRDTDYEGNVFPDALDLNGDGLLYYVIPGSEYQHVSPIDFAQYSEWRGMYVKNEQPLDVPMYAITAENIQLFVQQE